MHEWNRRNFVGAMALAGLAADVDAAEAADEPVSPAAAASAKDVTRTLARYVFNAKPADLPEAVRKEARRTLLNWLGCAVGGSHHETVDHAVAAMAPFAGAKQATVVGRKERLDVLTTAMLNGISSHIFDFDDTHLRTIIHPAGPVASAILALAEYHPVTGRDFINALVLGVEAECRIGNAVYPAHYDTGWHITGSVGVFGAAAAAGKLLGLTEQQMVWALGIAAVQPVGLREMFGTMTKSFHPGRAAHNGLTAALLAARNFTSSEQGIEAKYGWANVLSTRRNYREITENLGKTYEISINTYKPFACGIVVHPSIDGAIRLRNQNKLTPEQVERVELKVHRLVFELTGNKEPQNGLGGKFSVYHAVAAALIEGAAGEQQFSDRTVRDATVVGLRKRVTATLDPSLAEDQAHVAITLKDGKKLEVFVEHAVGSVTNPMSDKDLENKFQALAQGVLPVSQTKRLIDLLWRVEELGSAADIAKAAAA
jgi:2-methylcitrate dehydratase PrpD